MSRKTFAIIGALIVGGVGIAVMSAVPQAAQAGIQFN
jgi:hypothetical protein